MPFHPLCSWRIQCGFTQMSNNLGNPAIPPSASLIPIAPPSKSDGSQISAAKTCLCNKFNTPEGCKCADKCHFAHGARGLGRPFLLSGHEALVAAPSMIAGRGLGVRHEPFAPPKPWRCCRGGSFVWCFCYGKNKRGCFAGGRHHRERWGEHEAGVPSHGARLSIGDHKSDLNLRNIEFEGTFDQIKQATGLVRELVVNLSSATAVPIPVPAPVKTGAAAGLGVTGSRSGGGGSNFKTVV